MILGERSSKRAIGESAGEIAKQRFLVGGPFLGPAQFAKMRSDVPGGFDRAVGRRLLPSLRDRRPALVADAAIVGRKRSRGDISLGKPIGRQISLRDRLGDAPRRLPLERDRGLDRRRLLLLVLRVVHSLLGFGKLQLERIGPAAEKLDRRAIFGIVPRLDPSVDQRLFSVVDPESRRVFRTDDEFIFAGIRGQDRAFPADRELIGLELVGFRPLFAEIEPNLRVDAIEDEIAFSKSVRLVIFRFQTAGVVPTARLAKLADEVGEHVAILSNGQARQLDPRRRVPRSARFWSRRRRKYRLRRLRRPCPRRFRDRPRASSWRSASRVVSTTDRPRAVADNPRFPRPIFHDTRRTSRDKSARRRSLAPRRSPDGKARPKRPGERAGPKS